jgi:hypothetical protein
LRLISIVLDLSKFGRFSITCIVDFTDFKRCNFMISHFKKTRKKYRSFMQEKVLIWGPSQFSTSLDLPALGISNPQGKTEGGRRPSPSTRVFLSLSHLVPSATDPGGLSLPSLSLSLSLSLPLARLFVCLLRGTLSQPTGTVSVLHLSTEVPYCGGPGSRTLIEKATRLILQKLLQPSTESL